MDAAPIPGSRNPAPVGPIDTVRTVRGLWHVDRASGLSIISDQSPDFFALERAANAERVKAGVGRTTWRVTLDEGNVYCKVYERGRGWRWLTRRLRGSAARREFHRARTALRRGVNVPRPIAWGRQTSRPYRTVVVSQEIPGAAPLTDYSLAPQTSSSLIDAVACLLATAHNAGLLHLDGHPGNMLVRNDSATGHSAWFVDLHAVRCRHRPVSLRTAVRALGQLEHHYEGVASAAQRFRFLARYLNVRAQSAGRPRNRSDVRQLVQPIRWEASTNAVRLAGQRDKRLKRDNKYFTTVRAMEYRGRVVLKLARRRRVPTPLIPDRSIADWKDILHTGPSYQSEGDDRKPSKRLEQAVRFCVTHHDGIVGRLRITLFGSPAQHAFRQCHQLRHRDLPTPLVLGYMERRRRGLIDSSVLILAKQHVDTGGPAHRDLSACEARSAGSAAADCPFGKGSVSASGKPSVSERKGTTL